jgi:hypothetical protein
MWAESYLNRKVITSISSHICFEEAEEKYENLDTW